MSYEKAGGSGRTAPGSGASPVLGYELWNSMFSLLSSRRSKTALVWHAAKAGSAQNRAPEGVVWPLPLPFPELHRRGANRHQRDAARKLALNFIVLNLNCLFKPEGHWRGIQPPLGTPLNRRQWAVVKELTPHVDAWNAEAKVGPQEMGRSAAKIESVEETLSRLEEGMVEHAAVLRSYMGKTRSGMQTSWGFRGSPGEVIGALDAEVQHVAKSIEPERLKFWGTPTFDPCPFLDPHNKETFQRPLDFALPPDLDEIRPPRVRVRVDSRDKIALLEKLDAGKRLALLPLREVRHGFLNGMFAVPKDSERDRMVLDARPPNALEDNSDPWLGSSGTNRNGLQLHVRPEEVRHLSCFSEELWREEKLVPCLATMAMGDCRAVGFGQVSHLGVLWQETSLRLDDFICLRQRPPRQRWMAGLMIDDFLLVEAVQKTEDGLQRAQAEEKISEVREAYERVGLPRHEGKAVAGASEGAFWGAQICGKSGLLRPNLKRAIPLAFLALRLLNIGSTTVSLLEVLAGSFVSVFQLRRRLMSCMDEIYAAQRGRERRQIISISLELHDEILCLLSLLPLSCIDMRLKASPFIVASDASTQYEAAVEAEVGVEVVKELQKHTVQKGMWNKLLAPYRAFLREKGCFEELEELPEGEYDMHPAFEEVVSSCRFRSFGPVRKVLKRRHINLGEVRAALEAEKRQGLRRPGSFYIHLQDSQVSLAAITKGRSSSRAINKLLKSSVPWHVGSNNRSFGAYVRSKKNPADDPTRRVRIRRPVRPPADWLVGLTQGHTEEFDEMLLSQSADRATLSELPEESQLWREVVVTAERLDPLSRGESAEHSHQCRAAEGSKALNFSCHGESANNTAQRGAAEGRQVLSREVCDLLRSFPEDQFLFSSDFASLEEAFLEGPGILDLFSGERGVAKCCVARGKTWVLCFDLKHDPGEDLLLPPVQDKLVKLVTLGAFFAMGAAPVCASFSMAVTPPCRSPEFPEGLPDVSEKQMLKNWQGNQMLAFVQRLILLFLEFGGLFWCENPDGSWMWRQRGELSWDKILGFPDVGDLRLDFCRFGTPWRKRTRFRTNLHVRGSKVFCNCSKPHVRLRGRCKEKKCSFTKLAEPYPRGVADLIAAALLADSGLLGKCKKLDVAACAKAGRGRIGEAANPGPRQRPANRDRYLLQEVSTLEHATVVLRRKLWDSFLQWFQSAFPGASIDEWMAASPCLLVSALVAFGHDAFASGTPLHYYRQLLAHTQREFPFVRVHMFPAWETVSKWELLEPVQHRPPLPEPILHAMAALGLSWGWFRWTAVLVASFYSISRVGELLRARRSDVLTPKDLLDDQEKIYIRISEPKSRRRGARIQHVTVDNILCLRFLAWVWDALEKPDFLYSGSAGAFRSRWNATLRHLGISTVHRLTPGSLRAGGAVAAHRRGMHISDLLWRMRLQHVQTLSHYLQETTAISILPALPSDVRDRILALRTALPLLLHKWGP
eukprot:s87_g38.t1